MFLNQYNNTEATVIKLLRRLSIATAPEKIIAELERHPDYPSLLAISDVLTNFNIENSAFRVSYDELSNLSLPFIAHTKVNKDDFVIVDRVDEENIWVSNEKWSRHKLSLQRFKELYTGIVLTAERAGAPGPEPKTTLTSKLIQLKFPVVIAGLLVCFFAALVYRSDYFVTLQWPVLLLTVLKSAGLCTAILLLVQSIDSNNPLVQKLCESVNQSNCNAILSSKAANAFEWLTWSEVGFFYFAGTWLLLLFGGGSILAMRIILLLNIISLPYTFYSIYYQARVAKQWCVLCCTIQAILWLEFVPQIIVFYKSSLSVQGGSHNGEWSGVLICLLLPVLFWMLLKPLLLKIQQLPTLKQQLHKFKYNTELFNNMMVRQPKYTQPNEDWSIVLGNSAASNVITMVTNPYCPPCTKMHKLLHELLEQRADIQARIVFAGTNTDSDIKTPVSRHLMALNEQTDKSKVLQALYDWYEQKQKNYEAWAKAYPVALNGIEFKKLEEQKAWCQIAEVTSTPTMLLNGYRLPNLYQLPDLKYMLE
jgi:uncharacterized membrane protein